MRKICLAIIAIVLILTLSACSVESPTYSSPVQISSNEIVMLSGTDCHLFAKTSDPSAKLSWSSSDERVAKVNGGLVVAVSVGEAEIIVKGGDQKATCNVTVADSIVSKSYTYENFGYGMSVFSSIADAARNGGVVVVMAGDYPEVASCERPLTLIGKGDVSLLGVVGKNVKLDNLTFVNNQHPEEGKSTVAVTESLSMNKCRLSVSTDKTAADLKGGSAIYVGNACKSIEVIGSEVSGYAMGIVMDKTAAAINIRGNGIANCSVGIRLDIKGSGDMVTDYKASGVIKGNIINKCGVSTEFSHGGSNYYGEVDFSDHTKHAAPPKAKEKK